MPISWRSICSSSSDCIVVIANGSVDFQRNTHLCSDGHSVIRLAADEVGLRELKRYGEKKWHGVRFDPTVQEGRIMSDISRTRAGLAGYDCRLQ